MNVSWSFFCFHRCRLKSSWIINGDFFWIKSNSCGLWSSSAWRVDIKMRPFPAQQKLLILFSVWPKDEPFNQRKRAITFVMTSALFVINALALVVAGMYAFEMAAVNLELSLFAMFPFFGYMSASYGVAFVFYFRHKIADLFKRLKQIYEKRKFGKITIDCSSFSTIFLSFQMPIKSLFDFFNGPATKAIVICAFFFSFSLYLPFSLSVSAQYPFCCVFIFMVILRRNLSMYRLNTCKLFI